MGDSTCLLSKEGVTQGDNLAMGWYAVSTVPIMEELRAAVPDTKQVWFADDNIGGGLLNRIKDYWDALKKAGPERGYFPKGSKTKIVVKTEELRIKAEQLFEGEEITITVDGSRYIGAPLGTELFKHEYMQGKVEKWIQDVEELSIIAKEEPQVALSAYNIGLCQRWTFLQRMVKEASDLFLPLENAIRNTLIPALLGRDVSPMERRMIALPYRYGGLGIRNPAETADLVYQTSCEVTSQLTDMICNRHTDLSLLDREKVHDKKKEMKSRTGKATES